MALLIAWSSIVSNFADSGKQVGNILLQWNRLSNFIARFSSWSGFQTKKDCHIYQLRTNSNYSNISPSVQMLYCFYRVKVTNCEMSLSLQISDMFYIVFFDPTFLSIFLNEECTTETIRGDGKVIFYIKVY